MYVCEHKRRLHSNRRLVPAVTVQTKMTGHSDLKEDALCDKVFAKTRYIVGLVYNYRNSLSENFTGDAKNVLKHRK